MKKNLAALELHYLLKELKILDRAKIAKVYQPQKKEIVIQFHLPGIGKKFLRISLPDFVYLTEFKSEVHEPPHFCMILRKYLMNARVISIEQKHFERIIEITFSTKDHEYRLIIELFSKGNIILCNKEYEIIAPLETQRWKDRTIKRGEKYEYPVKEFNPQTADLKQFKSIFKKTDKESVVKTLAIDLGLGGLYSEELCYISKIDKNKEKASEKDVSTIYDNLKKLLNKKIKTRAYLKDNKLKDIVPFEINKYEGIEKKEFGSFNEAINQYITQDLKDEIEKEDTKEHDQAIDKINRIIDRQELKIKDMESSIKRHTKNGELIYENYKLVDEILKEIAKAREKYSWKEIQEKLKGSKIIKSIDESQGKITIEIK